MTTPKIRALQALADATDRPFLATAPLMAIVEAVQVLDDAGLLGDSTDRDLRDRLAAEYLRNAELTEAMEEDAIGSAMAKMSVDSVAAESALRKGIVVAMNLDTEDDIRAQLRGLLDNVKATAGALLMCKALDDAEDAKSVLDDEGFHGRTLEAQVRALVVAWSDERDEARRLRAGLPLPIDEETRTRLMATLGCNPGSMQAVMHGVAALPWVDTVNHRVGPGRDSLVIGTRDGMGLDDLRRADLRAALDTQRAAGVPIVAEIDGWPFTHPEGPLPCPDCGAEANEAHSGDCEALPPGSCKDCGAPPDHSHLPDCDIFAPMVPPPADVEAERVPCPKCGVPLTPTGMCLNFPACPESLIPF